MRCPGLGCRGLDCGVSLGCLAVVSGLCHCNPIIDKELLRVAIGGGGFPLWLCRSSFSGSEAKHILTTAYSVSLLLPLPPSPLPTPPDPELCPSYPTHVIVPTCTGELDYMRGAKQYHEGRFPTLTWYDQRSGAALLRAASTHDER